jgi:integrase/recombinase XerD
MTSSTSVSANVRFSGTKAVYLDRSIEKSLADGVSTSKDISLIREFVNERRAAAGISLSRSNKITYTLVGWRRFIPSYSDLTIGDIYTGIEAMNNGLNSKGTPFMQNTRHDWILILKQFLRWLIENEYTQLSEKKVRRIKIPNANPMTKTAASMITQDEIKLLIATCTRSYDRALIAMIYEGGLRIGEAGMMKWGDISFNKSGLVVNVKFKTNIPRYVPIIALKEYITQWRADYPGNPEGESPVFVNHRNSRLTNAAAIRQLQRVAVRAGITKHITPHLFRHSRITHMIGEGVSESVIKLIMWGSVNSNMLRTYAHLTGTEIEKEMRRVYGIEETNEDNKSVLEPRICPNCHMIMPPVADYCSVCGENLANDAPANQDEIQAFVLKHGQELIEYLLNSKKGGKQVQASQSYLAMLAPKI